MGDAVVGLDDGLGVGDVVGTFVGLTVVGSLVIAELFVAVTGEFVSPAALGERIVALLLLLGSKIVGLAVGDINEGKVVAALLLPSYSAPSTSSSYLNAVSSFVGSSVLVGTCVGVDVGADVGTDVGSSVGSGVGSSVGTGVGASVSTEEVGEAVGSSVSGIPVGKSEGSRVWSASFCWIFLCSRSTISSTTSSVASALSACVFVSS